MSDVAKCPKCEKYIDITIAPDMCPKCGEDLKGVEISPQIYESKATPFWPVLVAGPIALIILIVLGPSIWGIVLTLVVFLGIYNGLTKVK